MLQQLKACLSSNPESSPAQTTPKHPPPVAQRELWGSVGQLRVACKHCPAAALPWGGWEATVAVHGCGVAVCRAFTLGELCSCFLCTMPSSDHSPCAPSLQLWAGGCPAWGAGVRIGLMG